MNSKDLEGLVFEEAMRDLAEEAEGTPATIGEMRRNFPDAYEAARQLALGLAGASVSFALSKQQAEKISEMIHSEDEGLSSIQDVLNMQPVNALTLVSLVRLERQRTANSGAEARHKKPGGSRDKRSKIRAAWMSGKYKTRDECANTESAKLRMSFSAARKALQKTPDPPSRCK